jgi:bifunctional ADP-heptose synthase (sugar kinase/adenylyltransferase)
MNKILLLGDSCIDVFIYGDCYRLNPEAPTPVFTEKYRIQFDGMAGNVLTNIQKLGLEADFLTHEEEIIKTRYIDEKSNYILLRVDNDESIKSVYALDVFDFSSYDLTIVSDYNKGFLKERDLELIFQKSKLSFIDTKKPIDTWIKNASFIKINEAEYMNPKNNLYFMSTELNDKLIITLGEMGAKYNEKLYKPLKEILVRDVVGAGDSFLASLACHYYLYKNIEDAINFANLCAGQVVSKKGIAFPDEKLI